MLAHWKWGMLHVCMDDWGGGGVIGWNGGVIDGYWVMGMGRWDSCSSGCLCVFVFVLIEYRALHHSTCIVSHCIDADAPGVQRLLEGKDTRTSRRSKRH